jgi:HPt (histidine-containing phosphotransfer) domain-containing protein
MTAHAMKGEREKSIAAGMNDHITKPIDPEILYKALLKYVKGIDPSGIMGQSSVASSEKEEEWVIMGLDTKEGLRRIGNKKEAYRKLLQTFVSNYTDTPSSIASMRLNNDLGGLATLLHTLSGVCGNIGAKELYAVAYPLSHGLKALDQEKVKQLSVPQQKQLEHIEKHLDGLIQELRSVLSQQDEVVVQKSNLDEEKWEQKKSELIQLIESQDSDAIPYCDNWINQFQLQEQQSKLLHDVKIALSEFEFDAALEILK